jgi:hypothetical protein
MIEAMKQIVKEAVYHRGGYWIVPEKEFESLRQAIAEAEKQEPVAWMYDWTSDEGEFIQDWTTSMAETLRDTGKTIITNVRPLYLTPKVIHKPLQHFGEIPMAWCRWSEDLGKWMYTHRQPTEELAWIPLYTHPQPKREWVGLTDEEMNEAMDYWSDSSRSAYGGAHAADGEYVSMISTWRYIEAKLKEKNT